MTEAEMRERLQELEDILRILAHYTRDSWVQDLVERVLDDR
jgi:hypothetical protein